LASQFIDGLMLSIIDDMGPDPVLNLSSLDELTTHKLSIVGMTILSMGLGSPEIFKKRYYRLHGPIPVPDFSKVEALCVPFNVSADLGTNDSRVEFHGRECTLWYLFDSNFRKEIISIHGIIEKVTKEILRPFKSESQLDNKEIFVNLLNSVKEIEFDNRIDQKSNLEENLQFSIDNTAFGFYSINNQGFICPVIDLNNIQNLDVLLLTDLIEERINVMKLNPIANKRRMFLAGRAASKLNSSKLKNAFKIRDIEDDIEIQMMLQKIDQIRKDLVFDF
jgi:hypothetical protein